jgi:hypothetical protein
MQLIIDSQLIRSFSHLSLSKMQAEVNLNEHVTDMLSSRSAHIGLFNLLCSERGTILNACAWT